MCYTCCPVSVRFLFFTCCPVSFRFRFFTRFPVCVCFLFYPCCPIRIPFLFFARCPVCIRFQSCTRCLSGICCLLYTGITPGIHFLFCGSLPFCKDCLPCICFPTGILLLPRTRFRSFHIRFINRHHILRCFFQSVLLYYLGYLRCILRQCFPFSPLPQKKPAFRKPDLNTVTFYIADRCACQILIIPNRNIFAGSKVNFNAVGSRHRLSGNKLDFSTQRIRRIQPPNMYLYPACLTPCLPFYKAAVLNLFSSLQIVQIYNFPVIKILVRFHHNSPRFSVDLSLHYIPKTTVLFLFSV